MIVAFCWSAWCISSISAGVGYTILFDGELCVGSVVGAGDVDIDEASGGNVGVFVSWSRTEISFEIVC